MGKKLSDVKVDFDKYIDQAKKCAEHGFGFAAMMMSFAIILSICEALVVDKEGKGKKSIKKLIEKFVENLPETKGESWLIGTDVEKLTDDNLVDILRYIRDGLMHQMSMPPGVYLANNKEGAKEFNNEQPGMFVISTIDFVKQVDDTIVGLIAKNLDVIFDPQHRFPRDLASAFSINKPTHTTAVSGIAYDPTNPPKTFGDSFYDIKARK